MSIEIVLDGELEDHFHHVRTELARERAAALREDEVLGILMDAYLVR